MTVNLGLRPLEIELLYFEGCPGYNETLGIVRKTAVEEGLAARVVPVVLEYDDNRPGFSGSPTFPWTVRISLPLGTTPPARAAR